ncbi:PspC domain-containing protein [Nocardia sp. 348MFTsu5.1]|uniref:PspC domain-containing protein n=1 Tax=Nocardia sp. 348MFTsu5.1 TaxID=1172185 RepID=UPI000363E1BC|nr:PspC domain-containing protein [Nocardia sp. 348MFTsu5.1]
MTTSSTGTGTDDLQKQVQKMWQTRPARATTGSTVGGVCAGIGARYKVDPNLVKVAFIVAALFGGSGLVLYIAAWIVLPEGSTTSQPGAQHHHRRWHGFRHSTSHPPTVAAIVVLVILVLVLQPNMAWSGGGLAGTALMLLGWWLLYQRTPIPEPGTSADTLGQQSGSAQAVGPQAATTGSWWANDSGSPGQATDQFQRWTPRSWLKDETPAGADGPAAGAGADAAASDPLSPPSPPSWDPLGVAPFAWDLPEPAPPEEKKPSSRFTPIVLGLAIIATAVTAGLSSFVDWLSPAEIASVGLLVLAVGLLIGAFTRRGLGLIPIAIPVAGFVVVASLISGIGFPSGGVGDRNWKPLTAADLKDSYSLAMGNGTLDLTNIDLTENATVTAEVGVGEFKVIAPAGMNIRADCDVAVGEVNCPDGLDGGNDGTKGPVVVVDLSASLGNVEVTRE